MRFKNKVKNIFQKESICHVVQFHAQLSSAHLYSALREETLLSSFIISHKICRYSSDLYWNKTVLTCYHLSLKKTIWMIQTLIKIKMCSFRHCTNPQKIATCAPSAYARQNLRLKRARQPADTKHRRVEEAVRAPCTPCKHMYKKARVRFCARARALSCCECCFEILAP